jgi:hypothetical protein
MTEVMPFYKPLLKGFFIKLRVMDLRKTFQESISGKHGEALAAIDVHGCSQNARAR